MINTQHTMTVGMLLFPDLTLLDFAGPYDVFVKASCFEVCTVAATSAEISAEGGLTVKADFSFENCPLVDILFVPGGKGITALLQDITHLDFLRNQAESAKYITSVCTGALLLAAAGLLKGYRATTHWRSLELLSMFGIDVLKKRVVVDRNRVTGGGVTAGIDFGLLLTALIGGEDEAKLVQLMLEYNPEVPFNSGSPDAAEAAILNRALEVTAAVYELRKISIGLMTVE